MLFDIGSNQCGLCRVRGTELFALKITRVRQYSFIILTAAIKNSNQYSVWIKQSWKSTMVSPRANTLSGWAKLEWVSATIVKILTLFVSLVCYSCLHASIWMWFGSLNKIGIVNLLCLDPDKIV